ncbi:MAG: GAF domain-containing protein [Anaerolineae bacterium]|nr:GAF domain-containing protein [Anaerolineae bacterium]
MIVVVGFGLALGIFSLVVVSQRLPDSLLLLFATPIVLSPLFSYGRRVYLSMWILLALDAIWVTSILSSNWRASLLIIVLTAASSIIMTEVMSWLFQLRRRSEEHQRENEEKYRQLFELESDALFLIDNETGQILEANATAVTRYGYTREELLAKKNTDLSAEPEQTRKATVEEITSVPIRFHCKKDGTIFPVEITGKHFAWQGRQVHIAAIRDITQRLQAEQALQDAEMEKRIILDSLGEHVVYHDLEHRIIWVNQAGADSAGLSRDDLIGQYCYHIWPQAAERCPDCPVAIAMRTGKPQSVEKGTPDGRQWLITGYAVRAPSGDVIGGIEVTEDITERKQAHERIAHLNAVLYAIRNVNQLITRQRDRVRLLQNICDSLIETRGYRSAWIVLADVSGEPTAAAKAGLGKWQVPDQLQRDLLPHCIAQAQAQANLLVIKDRSAHCANCPLSPKEKGTGTLAIRLEHEGRLYGVLAVSLPINLAADTDEQILFQEVAEDLAYALYSIEQRERRKQAEDALLWEINVTAAMAKLAQALLTSPSIQEISDLVLDDARVLTNSPLGYTGYIEQMTGWFVCPTMTASSPDARAGTSKHVVIKTFNGLWAQAMERRQPILDNNPDNAPLPMGTPADHIPIRRLLCVPVLADGEPIGQIGLANAENDYTDRDLALVQRLADIYAIAIQRKQLEERLLQSQKMEAVGRLAGGIAHDFNNHLTTITGYSELALVGLPDTSPLRTDIESILKAARRSASLTQQLLAFSRKQMLEMHLLDLNQVIAEMEDMLRRLIGENINLVTALTSRGSVRADRGQIEQVIMNLVVNARDAIQQKPTADGGHLIIGTADVASTTMPTPYRQIISPGHHVRLTITDNGIGMNMDTQSHIFEPFFTTKGTEQGTGLGLATVYGIVKQCSGSIFVDSEPGYGTTFTIYLPRIDEESETQDQTRAEGHSPRGTETILLVEDEQAVRTMARRILEHQGYTVLEANNAAHALTLCDQHPETIDLILTDVVMPGGIDGRSLADRITTQRPGIKVLYMSGYTDDAIAHHGVLEPGVHLLPKPFTSNALAQEVRDVLAGR